MSGLLIRWTCAAQATWHDSDDSKSCQHVLIWKSCLDLFHICSLCWSGFCCCQDFIILAILLILPWNEWNYLEVLHCFRCQIFSSGLPLHVFQRQHAKAFSVFQCGLKRPAMCRNFTQVLRLQGMSPMKSWESEKGVATHHGTVHIHFPVKCQGSKVLFGEKI